MVVVALVGGVVLGFVEAQFLMDRIQLALQAQPALVGLATCGVAAFLGVIWGWVARGVFGGKAKD